MVTGSFLDHRLGKLGLDPLGGLGEARAAFAERRLLTELGFERLDLVGDPRPLLVLGGQQGFQLLALLVEGVVLAPDLHLLEFAQSAQAHIEDRFGLHVAQLEGLHQGRLRLVLLADDFDDLVEIEIDDEVAVEHFEPVIDLGEAEFRAADQHHLAMVEPFAQDLAEPEHVRHLAAAQHIHIEGKPRLELGQPEQRFHEQKRIDAAALGLEHEPHGLGRLVAYVGQKRQLLLQEKLGDAGDEPRFGDLIGNFGDDDLVGAAPRILRGPARAEPEAAAAGLVGVDDLGARLDDHPAGRQIGAWNEIDQLVRRRVRELDEVERGVEQLAGIVRRDVGGHADGDA